MWNPLYINIFGNYLCKKIHASDKYTSSIQKISPKESLWCFTNAYYYTLLWLAQKNHFYKILFETQEVKSNAVKLEWWKLVIQT